jgi:IS5 family transposase
VPCETSADLVAASVPEGTMGWCLFDVEAMLLIHFMQQWFTLSDLATEEALQHIALFQEFAGVYA